MAEVAQAPPPPPPRPPVSSVAVAETSPQRAQAASPGGGGAPSPSALLRRLGTPSSTSRSNRGSGRRIKLNLTSEEDSHGFLANTQNTNDNNTGVRLYQVGMDMKQNQQTKLQQIFDEDQQRREVKVSEKTLELAYSSWARKIRKSFELAKDYDDVNKTISLDNCVKCFQRCGFLATRKRHTGAVVKVDASNLDESTILNTSRVSAVSGNESSMLQSSPTRGIDQSMVSNAEETLTSPQKLKRQHDKEMQLMGLLRRQCGEESSNLIYLDRVLRLIGVAIGHFELVENEFDARLMQWIRSCISTPVARERQQSPEEVAPKTIPLRLFLTHLDQETKHSQEVLQKLKDAREAELAKDLTFTPNISPYKRSTKALSEEDAAASIYDRLYEEAYARDVKSAAMRLRFGKEKLDRLAKDCTFSPTITSMPQYDEEEETFPSCELEAIQQHFQRLEIARLRKEDEQDRFEALGRVSPIKVARREHIPSRMYPKKTNLLNPQQEPDMFINIILPNEREVKVHVNRLDNISQLAEEFARKFQLDPYEQKCVEEAIRQALFLNTGSELEEQPLERYWDNMTRRWYLFDPVTGETKWAD